MGAKQGPITPETPCDGERNLHLVGRCCEVLAEIAPVQLSTVEFGKGTIENMLSSIKAGVDLPEECVTTFSMVLKTINKDVETQSRSRRAGFIINLNAKHKPHEFNCFPSTLETTGFTNEEKAAMSHDEISNRIMSTTPESPHPLEVVTNRQGGLMQFGWLDSAQRVRKMSAAFRVEIRRNGDRVVLGILTFHGFADDSAGSILQQRAS